MAKKNKGICSVTGRCSQERLHSFFGKITKDKKKLIGNTVFRRYLDIPFRPINKTVIAALLKTWDEEENAFNLGNCLVKFPAEEASMYLGLPLQGQMMHFEKKRTPKFVTEYFGANYKDWNSLEERLVGMLIEDEDDKLLFLQLTIVYMCSIFFFAANKDAVEYWPLNYLSSVEEINSLAWAKSIHHNVMEEVREAACGLKDYNRSRKEFNMKGCLAILETFAYVHITKLEKVTTTNEDLMLPRIFRWEKGDGRKVRTMNQIFVNLTKSEIEKFEIEDRERIAFPEICASSSSYNDDDARQPAKKEVSDKHYKNLWSSRTYLKGLIKEAFREVLRDEGIGNKTYIKEAIREVMREEGMSNKKAKMDTLEGLAGKSFHMRIIQEESEEKEESGEMDSSISPVRESFSMETLLEDSKANEERGEKENGEESKEKEELFFSCCRNYFLHGK